jgi:hypothetical protein
VSPVNRVIGTELDTLQRESFSYFEHECNPVNGLVVDKTAPDSPASIAATGFALAAYPVGVERGFISRAAAITRTLASLRFFSNSAQGPEADATGYQGLLLSLSRHANRTTRQSVRTVDGRQRFPARGYVDDGSVFRCGYHGGGGNPHHRRRALSTC